MRTYSSNKEILNITGNANSIGLIPTMGSLHEGHMSLIKRAINENDKVIVSIYVNPTQFNSSDDLKKYPRNLSADLDKLVGFNDVIVYAPKDNDIYGEIKKSKIYNLGKITTIMEGHFRPRHFEGVATIVEKLFKLLKPHNAYFGEKDFQQLLVVRSLVKKLKLNINIIGCETVRETDGLAMSSRNKLMTKDERKIAGEIIKLLLFAKKSYHKSSDVNQIKKDIINKAESIHYLCLEYFEIINFSEFSDKNENIKDVRAFIACKIGDTRLIDNIKIDN